MGYLVKASFNAEPRAYSLERIKTDVSAGSLSAEALVRHEKQDFWYSVGELIGEAPTTEFQFACSRCQAMTRAREIDVGLEVPCQACGESVPAPDVPPVKDPTPDLPLLHRGNHLLTWGSVIFFGNMLLSTTVHGLYGFVIVELVGVCMMINGYGKRQIYYRKHPPADDPVLNH